MNTYTQMVGNTGKFAPSPYLTDISAPNLKEPKNPTGSLISKEQNSRFSPAKNASIVINKKVVKKKESSKKN